MSFCRWSSDNWMCDVYVYEHVCGGFQTHVAKRRRIIPPIPELRMSWVPNMGGVWNKESRTILYPTRAHMWVARFCAWLWAIWHRYVHIASLRLIPLRDITLPHAGESFNDATAADCAKRLRMLRGVGYRVPQWAIDALEQEAEEASNA